MTRVVLVVPDAVDDARHPSGGNRYDRELATAIAARGDEVAIVRVPAGRTALEPVLARLPADVPALVDGLLLEEARPGVRAHAVVPLLHMPPSSAAAVEEVVRAPLVVVTSAWTRDRVQDLLHRTPPVVVARPGVRGAHLVAGSAGGAVLRCVAALLPHKGQDVLVAALGLLTDREWRCELVGATDLHPGFTNAVRHRIDDLGLGRRVLLTGPRGADPVSRLYRGADLVVAPSRRESYGMAAAEAIACGVPVVAADVGGMREALGAAGAGLLVPADDPVALAAALRRWTASPGLRAELAARARAVPHRTWAATAEGVMAALQGALRPHAAALR